MVNYRSRRIYTTILEEYFAYYYPDILSIYVARVKYETMKCDLICQ